MSVSPNVPSLIRYASTPSQWLPVGAWANTHGQAMLQVQTSNQSPLSDHVGTAVTVIGADSLTHRQRRLVTSRGTSGSVSRPYR